ncbi:MAG: SMC-Scp complex subunit ScpB [Floccifex porci]|uniref:SMC-Scp complex subunit ScpB n=1 Tax=Floccifex porci TaxID=2606629 RepID=UPI0023F14704|nr:SMC-Scp complex subunit ScpB [Floccifex porci]MCI7802228.1 SMC-Scp complex subunit ScpB [Erysipelotrichaceae bacterium]MDD7467064.1 SMC-Scp complex subunit ScpB [Floccifex porci]MDO4480934.1 SMC-Scp complex subunit ScpB [Erysipelotrichaceae bacterium]MDY4797091.1 SMC-Scp complex subunit ScpB [Floccifex porci]
MNTKAIIEGLLFLSGEEGLSKEQLSDAIQMDAGSFIETLKEEYRNPDKGFELVEFANRYKFITKEFVYPYAKNIFEEVKAPSLSPAALETLAIIAYKQPITRVEIEEIRGVNCEMMLKKLQLRNLIEAKDRKDVIGKPLLYTVTDEFLDTFQLESLKELPELKQKDFEDSELFEEIQ